MGNKKTVDFATSHASQAIKGLAPFAGEATQQDGWAVAWVRLKLRLSARPKYLDK